MPPATIEITRRNDFFGRFRRLVLLVDGEVAARLKIRSTQIVEVPPGDHALQLKMDWCTSASVKISLRAGEQRRFVCKSPNPFKAFGKVFARHDAVFELLPID